MISRYGKYFGHQDRDTEKWCWIIDVFLVVRRVRASYSVKFSSWSYHQKSRDGGWSGGGMLKPYVPYLSAESSYWGDGLHFRTKKAARAELAILVKKKIKRLRRERADDLADEIKRLTKNLRS